MQRNKPATYQEIKDRFLREGLTIAAWARENNVNPRLASAILTEERACRSGQSHKIAVLMGIKEGVIRDD